MKEWKSSELLFSKGDRVVLFGLRSQSYNDRIGIVQQFVPSNLRFQVRLEDNGDTKCFKGNNLAPLPCLMGLNPDIAMEILPLMSQPRTFQEIKDATKRFQFLDDSKLSCVVKALWASSALDFNWIETKHIVERYARKWIPTCNFPKEKCILRFCLMSCKVLEDPHEALKVFTEMVEGEHFGLLPEIVSALMTVLKEIEIYAPAEKFYEKAVEFIEAGMYRFNFAPFMVHMHYLEVLAAQVRDGKVSLVNQAEELISNIRGKVPLNVSSRLLFIEGIMCHATGRYEKALKLLHGYEEESCKRWGMTKSLADVCYLKTSCYIGIGECHSAKKSLKRMRKFEETGIFPLWVIEKFEREMAPLLVGEKLKSDSTRAIAKCSNPLCSKMEAKVGSFKACGRCRGTVYCSAKCQKKHWKMGHKHNCVKNT